MTKETSSIRHPSEKSFIRRIFHWGPLITISIVTTIAFSTLVCLLDWWPPFRTVWGFVNLAVFLTWVALLLTNFFSAAHLGPGYVPFRWNPV